MRWTSRLFRQAVRNLRPTTRRPRARLRFEALEAREVPHIHGAVFVDLNQDGVQDAEDMGAPGVTVTATDDKGETLTATTEEDGSYELLTDADNVRIEFSGLPDGTLPGRVAGTSGPVVRFLNAQSPRTDVNLSLAAPQLITTQFFYDHALEGMNSFEGAVLAMPYGAQDSVFPTPLATVADVGSVWGLAYQPSSNSIYASAFLKRHAGFGPNAAGTGVTTGGIYRINPAAEEPGATLLIDLNALGFDTGANPHPTTPEFPADPGVPEGDWFHDPGAVGLVGKRSLGGLQVSPSGSELYTVNLNTRELIQIPLSPDGTRDTSRQVIARDIPLANPPGSGIAPANFGTGNVRPFAVAVKGNAVFVGVTYTAESNQRAADLRAFVYAYDPVQGAFHTYDQRTGTFATSGPALPVLTADLTYPRGVADDPTPGDPGDEVPAAWRPWSSTFNTSLGQEGFPVNPQPWLTDIVFDGEAMVLGLRDRFGDQAGFQTGAPSAADENQYAAIAVGDILRAVPNGSGGWQLESGATAGGQSTGGAGTNQGPGNGEFYFEDAAEFGPTEVVTGGLAQVPGFKTVAATGNDPIASFNGGVYTFFNTDPDAATKAAGKVAAKAEVYATFDLNMFGSANGLGDLEALPAFGKVQAGDRVFNDANQNGLQDPGEPGIAGVTVLLFQGDTQTATDTTDANGDFLFSDLTSNLPYSVRIDTTQSALAGATLTKANAGTSDLLDSDATLAGQFAVAAFTSPMEGTTDQGLDAGFVVIQQTGNLTLGNVVFRDTNNNGKFDNTGATPETGIAGVAVDLLDATGATVIESATTNASGVYTFAALEPGTYVVRLAASNFTGTGSLVGFTSSTATTADPDDNVDNDDNGTANGTLGSGGVIISGAIDLTDGTEPTTDGDTDANTNLTLDFGLVPPAAAGNLTLGNLVFNDANNNGTFDGVETGVNGVAVELLNAAGTVVDTKTTAGGGLYTFTGLAAGDYRVRLAASNFQAGGALASFTSSTATAPDPDDNVNNNDDGAVSGTLGSGGVIQSGLITLAAAGEPTTDGDTDNNTNLTLDFGVVAVAQNTLTLGDRVFRDANDNGLFDTGETGVAGVTVQLLNQAGSVLQAATTDATGLYSFPNLAAGDYKVRLPASNFQGSGALAGFTSSSPASADPDNNTDNNDDGTPTGTLGTATGFIESGLITLAAGGEPTTDGDTDANTNLTLDFGVVPGVLTVGNRVFNDANNNGLFDSGESGIQGVTVQLVNPIGTVLQTKTTDATGLFTFAGVSAGDYRVRLAASNFQTGGPLVGFTSSTGTNGSATGPFEGAATPDPDNNTDNDDNGHVFGTLGQATGGIETDLVTLAVGGEPTTDGDTDANTNLTLDLGVFQKFSIGNQVFNDANNNGTLDTGEAGLGGVTVRLLNAGAGNAEVATAKTSATGQYLFTHLAAGSYVVELAASNFNAGGPLFNFQSSTGTSNAFEPAPAGAADKQDHGTTTGTLGSGGSVRSETVTLGPGVPTGENPNTDPNTPDNQSNLTIDFGLFQQTATTASLAGRVFRDFNNGGTFNGPDTGIAGVTVSLSGGGLASPITVTTDAEGNFGFSNLKAGTYTLTETQPAAGFVDGKDRAGTAGGSTTTNDTITNIVLGNGQAATGYTFAEVPLVSTGGSVYEDLNGNGKKDAGEPGISGAIVTLTGTSVVTGTIAPKSAITDASGTYTFADLTPGTYTITETQQPAGYADGKEQNGTPPAATVSNDRFAGINLTTTAAPSGGFNFGEVKGASIAGVVFTDANDDGTQAPSGEPGIAGVTVRLTGTNDLGQAVSRSATTGSDGTYSFTGLRPGTYAVIETQPVGFTDGKETAGTAGGSTATNDRITGIQLDSGEAATGYLFGERTSTVTGVDLVLTRTPAGATIAPNGTVTITYTLRNAGNQPATAASVQVNFGGMTFVSSPTAGFNSATGAWTVGDLAPGGQQTLQVVLRAPAAGTFNPSATASTTATETTTANNTVSSTITARVAPPPPPPPPTTVLPSLWFLSSSTNAIRTPR